MKQLVLVLYGDELYDWAKLYYSIVGNYDRFNLKDFRLDIGGSSIYTEYGYLADDIHRTLQEC